MIIGLFVSNHPRPSVIAVVRLCREDCKGNPNPKDSNVTLRQDGPSEERNDVGKNHLDWVAGSSHKCARSFEFMVLFVDKTIKSFHVHQKMEVVKQQFVCDSSQKNLEKDNPTHG